MSEANGRPIKPLIVNRLGISWILALLLPLILSGCAAPSPSPTQASLDLIRIFPAADTVPGWTVVQAGQAYSHDNLFNLVDGQADSFFAYGFEAAAVQRYEGQPGVILNVEIWQVATPADAYGLFSAGRSGSPAALGNAGDSDPGRRLAFWQNRYFVSLNATRPVPDETLQAFARAIAIRLPSGGETPAIVTHLPKDQLVERSIIFFHEEMSIQMEVWLGGENLLGLSQETNGVVAHYQVGDVSSRLLLIEYPTPAQAASGLKALQGAGIANLLVSDARDRLLAAVIGKAGSAEAESLLQEALK